MPRVFLLLLFELMTKVSFSEGYPVIHNSRPRIWADQSRFDYISANVSTGECGTTYSDFLYRYNNYWINDPELYLLGSDSTLWTLNWNSLWAQNEGIFTAFLWKVTHDPLANKRCRFIIRKFSERIDSTNFANIEWYTKETLLRTFSDVGGVLLDWCYDSIPENIRVDLAKSIYRMNREFMNTYVLSGSGNSYVSSHNALYQSSGLSPQQQDTVVQWYQAIYDKWINGFLPCYTYYRDDDGGWNWGAAYAMWSLTDQFKLFDNLLIGTGKNFFIDLPWVHESINQYWYFMGPNDYTIHLGDGYTGIYADNVIYRHAAIFLDTRSQWMAQNYSQASFMTSTFAVFTKLFYKDFNAVTVVKPDPPHDWWSDKVGLSESRTSWDHNATLVWFFNSPSKKAAHEHRDNNTFSIFRNKPLIIDAGYYDSYGSNHFINYYTRTIAHNSICVFDSTDVTYYGSTQESNDGGQLFSNPLLNYNSIFAPENQRGKWIQYASSSTWSYQVADAGLSYDPIKLDVFKRRLLFYKPNRVVILDHVRLKNTNVAQRDIFWTAHFMKRPHIVGVIFNPVPGHLTTYSGQDYTMTNGNGNIAIRTIIPDSTKTRLVGGPGYEYYVNGWNYPPIGAIDTANTTPGSWRIEVRPQTIHDTIIYLHTIDIGDNTNLSVAGGTGIRNEWSIGTDWENTIFLFGAKGDTGISKHYVSGLVGNRTIHLWASDLKKNMVFYVFLDNSLIGTINSGINGIVETDIQLNDLVHSITISLNRITGNVIYNNSQQSLLPGVTVYLKQNGSLIAQTITNAQGQFSFPDLINGDYELSASSLQPWGGVNSTDALIAMKCFVQLITLPPLKKRAADVNANNQVTSVDALLIAKRYIGAITSFQAGDWIFETIPFNLNNSLSNNLIIKGICTGDVNGSYVP